MPEFLSKFPIKAYQEKVFDYLEHLSSKSELRRMNKELLLDSHGFIVMLYVPSVYRTANLYLDAIRNENQSYEALLAGRQNSVVLQLRQYIDNKLTERSNKQNYGYMRLAEDCISLKACGDYWVEKDPIDNTYIVEGPRTFVDLNILRDASENEQDTLIRYGWTPITDTTLQKSIPLEPSTFTERFLPEGSIFSVKFE